VTVPTTPSGTAYDSAGPEGAPCIVLIHGIGLDRRLWDEWIPPLADRYRVLRYDLPGHGESPPSPHPVSLAGLSDQLRELMDEVQAAQAILVGFSLGGMINRRFAMDQPDRVAGLVVLNSPHERSPAEQQAVEERVARTNEGGPEATMDATLQRWFTSPFLASNPETVGHVRNGVLSTDPKSYAECRVVLAKGVKDLIRPTPPIAAPTLVMTCENDSGSTPAMSHGIAAEIGSAETIIVPRLQHMGLVEEPGTFITPIVRFLDAAAGKAERPKETS